MAKDYDEMTLIELIEAYGHECACGGAGYTSDDSEMILEKIKAYLSDSAHGRTGDLVRKKA